MEVLFDNNMIVVFIFFLINILGYSEIKFIEQRICIAYTIIFIMRALNIIGIALEIMLNLLTIMVYVEILTEDKMKLKLLTQIKYILLDYLYQAVFTFHIFEVTFSLFFYELSYSTNLLEIKVVSMVLAIFLSVWSIHIVLSEDMEYASFTEIYDKIMLYPLNEFKYNKKFCQVSKILIYIEDRQFYTRKGYTVFSISSARNILEKKREETNYKMSRILILYSMFKSFIYNMKTHNRGYSTIGSQLLRTLAIKHGYENAWKRKIYEVIYTYIFLNCLYKYEVKYRVANREHFRDWIIYLYFHNVNTFLGKEDIRFSKILNAFDMQYNDLNKKDIYDISNEGVLIACWGLSKKTKYITKENIKDWIPNIEGVEFDVDKLIDMIKHLDEPYYNGQYLK